MRITIVIASLAGGGAERTCVNLANAWAARGHHATIVTISQNTRTPAYEIDPRVEHRDLGCPRWARSNELNPIAIAPVLRGLQEARCPELIHDITMIAMLRHAILATKPEVVVSIIDQTNVRVLAAMQGTRVPTIACEQTDARRISLRGWQGAREALYRRAGAVVAPDPTIAQWLAARGATATAIPNPLLAPPPQEVTRIGSRRRIVTLARLSAEKRPEFLVRSFASVSANYPDWDLEIYGAGPQRNSLEHLTEKLVPNGRIRFCGFSTDPYAVLANADLFVSASWVEGFGNAIWEALACGVPVVAMEAGPAVRSLVRDGVDGLIVKENNMAALAAALAQLMGDEVTRKAYAARAPEILTRFSMESALEKWDALLTEVLSKPGNRAVTQLAE